MNFAVIGAGNGGQAIAGYLGMLGYHVKLYDRDPDKVDVLSRLDGVTLTGAITGFGKVAKFCSDIGEAVSEADVIMVTTVANVHGLIARQMAPFLSDDQIIILNPGRTGGALTFRTGLQSVLCSKRLFIAEAQTLIYACRSYSVGTVNIIGVKDRVLLAALPASDTHYVLNKIKTVYSCFTAAESVLQTSLENIGAIFHPSIVLFNAATIERGQDFYFYRDMTPDIAHFIEQLDNERIDLGKAYGLDLLGVNDWISYAYEGTEGNTLCEKMKNNPAYYDIQAPSSIYTRQLMEDIPTGIIPMIELGHLAGLPMNLFQSVAHICTSLLGIDFYAEGRNMKALGLSGLDRDGIINYLKNR